MTTPEPQKPVFVEIRVDGKAVHRFLADKLVTNETRESLTLEAERWGPSAMILPENPVVPISEPQSDIFSHGMLVSSGDNGIAGGAGEFLQMPITVTDETIGRGRGDLVRDVEKRHLDWIEQRERIAEAAALGQRMPFYVGGKQIGWINPAELADPDVNTVPIQPLEDTEGNTDR